MTHSEILEELIKRNIVIDGLYEYRKWKNINNKDLKKIIEHSDMGDFKSFNEKIWYLMHQNKSRLKCSVCEKFTTFIGGEDGFREVCSRSCSALSNSRKEKIKNTSLERYGVEHPTQSQKYRDTCDKQYSELGYRPGGFNTPENKKAMLEKYGVENVFQSEYIKGKIKSTLQFRYGVDNPQQNKEIRRKTELTQHNRYGQIGWNPIKVKETLIAKYGVDNPLKSPIIREKIRQTSQARYGTDSPMQSSDIFEKCQLAQMQTRYRFKKYLMPSGDIRWVQGYEPQVINYLLQSGITEEDLHTERNLLPVIKYDFDNKTRVYFPDIFIPSKNMLIEVKSSYTWVKDIVKNLAKHEASKDAGYRHLIIIWDDSKDCIKEMIN